MTTAGYLCGCSITTNHANVVTGVAVCSAHYAKVDAQALIAAQATQIRALHRDEQAREQRRAAHARTIQEKLDEALRAGDVGAAQYYRGLRRLQEQADRAGADVGADTREILGKLDDIVQRMRAMAGG